MRNESAQNPGVRIDFELNHICKMAREDVRPFGSAGVELLHDAKRWDLVAPDTELPAPCIKKGETNCEFLVAEAISRAWSQRMFFPFIQDEMDRQIPPDKHAGILAGLWGASEKNAEKADEQMCMGLQDSLTLLLHLKAVAPETGTGMEDARRVMQYHALRAASRRKDFPGVAAAVDMTLKMAASGGAPRRNWNLFRISEQALDNTCAGMSVWMHGRILRKDAQPCSWRSAAQYGALLQDMVTHRVINRKSLAQWKPEIRAPDVGMILGAALGACSIPGPGVTSRDENMLRSASHACVAAVEKRCERMEADMRRQAAHAQSLQHTQSGNADPRSGTESTVKAAEDLQRKSRTIRPA